MLRRLILASTAFLPLPAMANDSIAELGTGGLVLSRSDAIAMEQEDLYISPSKVTVDYVFRNMSDKDVETIVAFPMPDIEGNPYWTPAIPNDKSENFLDFTVTIDGKPRHAALEHKAFAVDLDITEELRKHGVPLYPFGDAVFDALAMLPQQVADDWQTRGIIVIDEYDAGQGWQRVRSPFWKLKTTYWWRMNFPAGKTVKVAHRYKPSVGATAGVTFFYDGAFGGDTYADYKAKYCIDKGFENAILKAARQNPDGYPPLYENRISYILTTGGNWAGGTIGKFKLTVDKGDARNLVSFCGESVKKIGPTTFEMTAEDYYPGRNVEVLLLANFDWNSETVDRATDLSAPPARQKLPFPNTPAPGAE